MDVPALLRSVGSRVRALRSERGWSRRELAQKAELSERFLAQVEGGTGNPSLGSLAHIARALGVDPATLLAGPQGRVVALLGLRGAGKSTVGAAVGKRLGIPFVELDARVEEAAGLAIGELLELHGQEHYRRVERDVLDALLRDGEPIVVATSGGIVASPEAFERLRRGATTVWLRATPEEHMQRVLAQGDHRPMANAPDAMARLRQILNEREDLYRLAEHIVETSGRGIDTVVADVAALARAAVRAS